MATLSLQIVATNDTGYSQGTVWTAGILLGGHDGSQPISCGLRWLNATIPQGATINSASIHIRARNLTGTITNVHFKIRGHKGDAPQWAEGTFEPDLNFTATTAGIDFDPAVWTIDAYYDVDVTSVLQEMVNDGGWASGFDVAMVFFDDSSISGNSVQMYRFLDGDTTAMVLNVDYVASAAVLDPSTGTEAEIVAGGKVLTLTLTGETFIPN